MSQTSSTTSLAEKQCPLITNEDTDNVEGRICVKFDAETGAMISTGQKTEIFGIQCGLWMSAVVALLLILLPIGANIAGVYVGAKIPSYVYFDGCCVADEVSNDGSGSTSSTGEVLVFSCTNQTWLPYDDCVECNGGNNRLMSNGTIVQMNQKVLKITALIFGVMTFVMLSIVYCRGVRRSAPYESMFAYGVFVEPRSIPDDFWLLFFNSMAFLFSMSYTAIAVDIQLRQSLDFSSITIGREIEGLRQCVGGPNAPPTPCSLSDYQNCRIGALLQPTFFSDNPSVDVSDSTKAEVAKFLVSFAVFIPVLWKIWQAQRPDVQARIGNRAVYDGKAALGHVRIHEVICEFALSKMRSKCKGASDEAIARASWLAIELDQRVDKCDVRRQFCCATFQSKWDELVERAATGKLELEHS